MLLFPLTGFILVLLNQVVDVLIKSEYIYRYWSFARKGIKYLVSLKYGVNHHSNWSRPLWRHVKCISIDVPVFYSKIRFWPRKKDRVSIVDYGGSALFNMTWKIFLQHYMCLCCPARFYRWPFPRSRSLSAVLPSVSRNDSSVPNSTRRFLLHHPAKGQHSTEMDASMVIVVGLSQRWQHGRRIAGLTYMTRLMVMSDCYHFQL